MEEGKIKPNAMFVLPLPRYIHSRAAKGSVSIKTESLGGGSAWPTNIRGRAAGKSRKLPCPGVKFPKMIPCPGVKFP